MSNFLKKAQLKPRNYSLKNFPDERIADSIPMRIQPIEDPETNTYWRDFLTIFA